MIDSYYVDVAGQPGRKKLHEITSDTLQDSVA
jgi:hypothetical protein